MGCIAEKVVVAIVTREYSLKESELELLAVAVMF